MEDDSFDMDFGWENGMEGRGEYYLFDKVTIDQTSHSLLLSLSCPTQRHLNPTQNNV